LGEVTVASAFHGIMLAFHPSDGRIAGMIQTVTRYYGNEATGDLDGFSAYAFCDQNRDQNAIDFRDGTHYTCLKLATAQLY
jgi:hypothetical protein